MIRGKERDETITATVKRKHHHRPAGRKNNRARRAKNILTEQKFRSLRKKNYTVQAGILMRIFKEVVRSVHRRFKHRLGNLHWKKVIVVSIKILYFTTCAGCTLTGGGRFRGGRLK